MLKIKAINELKKQQNVLSKDKKNDAQSVDSDKMFDG